MSLFNEPARFPRRLCRRLKSWKEDAARGAVVLRHLVRQGCCCADGGLDLFRPIGRLLAVGRGRREEIASGRDWEVCEWNLSGSTRQGRGEYRLMGHGSTNYRRKVERLKDTHHSRDANHQCTAKLNQIYPRSSRKKFGAPDPSAEWYMQRKIFGIPARRREAEGHGVPNLRRGNCKGDVQNQRCDADVPDEQGSVERCSVGNSWSSVQQAFPVKHLHL